MTSTFVRAIAFTLAAVVTTSTLFAADAIAARQFAANNEPAACVLAHADQTVVIVGHRATHA